MFDLVESKDGPDDDRRGQRGLPDHERFETDFIGASEQDCRQWALQQQGRDNRIQQDIIAIADRQSADDETLSIQRYKREPGVELPGSGTLPQALNTWYSFRVRYLDARTVYAALSFTEPDVVDAVYYGQKEELTDARGIFDVAKAQERCAHPRDDVEER
ncbi:hypothetical protein H2198_003526 [Neophaeococcomyces mojaviensis]|uniref:Uncharacterized protein n=1 Tax=Neophaeococcomyces mojaviensis TaxID=3383035 RepID=A0ACC3AB80_9EURO|nr:hypothetical protein H2198_003526 [Knufia sp. JES_112]